MLLCVQQNESLQTCCFRSMYGDVHCLVCVALFFFLQINAPLISDENLHYNIMFLNKPYLFEFVVYTVSVY